MKQKINQKILDEGWQKIKPREDEEREVIKLQQGESITGLLTGRKRSNTFGSVYYLKVEDDPIEKVICGTTILNQKLLEIDDGTEVIIERLKDSKTESGRNLQNYEVWWR